MTGSRRMKAMEFRKLLFTPTLMFSILMVSIILLMPREGLSQEAMADTGREAAAGENVREEMPRKVVAYYFHGAIRCQTCRTIEAYAQEAIKGEFSKELNQGRLEWKVINVQELGNEHFMLDYKLSSWSLVLVDLRNGEEKRWKNLDRIWTLVRDKGRFMKYVQGELEEFLEEG